MGTEAGPSHKDRGHRHGGEPESNPLDGGDDCHPHVTTHTEQTRKWTPRGKGAESPRQAASEGTGILPRTRTPQPGLEVGAAEHQLHTGHPWGHWGGCGVRGAPDLSGQTCDEREDPSPIQPGSRESTSGTLECSPSSPCWPGPRHMLAHARCWPPSPCPEMALSSFPEAPDQNSRFC